ncbi:MAG: 50S ribosomal protein L18 [Desulforhabdus sp.]|jgi:large subunit ribosomal protein L18|nr:50S ribosomal protein L18 [Desulforhabdus sp.]
MASKTNPRQLARAKRKKRIRKKLEGTSERPRLTVFRSDKHIYAQIIDDSRGMTLASASTRTPDYSETPPPKGKVGAAEQVGTLIAQRAQVKGISKVVFDRNGFIYHGRVRALADAARKAGLDF